jgi:hypothetical protein
MRIKTSVGQALTRLLEIPHRSCTKAVADHWKVSSDRTVKAQSVFWLYCWAKTGMNSEKSRKIAVQVFDEILPISFARFDAVTNHANAREWRYTSGDIEEQLDQILARAR